MLTKRIIACLDVKDGKVVKGVGFRNHVVVGEVLTLAHRYVEEGVDELVFYDVTASPDKREADVRWIKALGRILDIPFCVGGGITSVEIAERILNAGADKISVNSPALRCPELINQLSEQFGVQCIVVGIDSRWDGKDWTVWQDTGREATIHSAQRLTREWIIEAQTRGAGEIVLNCMDRDGRNSGFDIEQLLALKPYCSVPLVGSGGAGHEGDFVDVFTRTGIEAALAAGAFHRREITVGSVKTALQAQGLSVRIKETKAKRLGQGGECGLRL